MLKRRFCLFIFISLLIVNSVFSGDYKFRTQTPADFNIKDGTVLNSRWASGVPMGGIGCGAVEIGTDGSIGNITFMNNFDKPTGWLQGGFFAIAINDSKTKKISAYLMRMKSENEFQNVSNISDVKFKGLFPGVSLEYGIEPPLKITLNAFSSLIPNDIRNSSLPVVFYDFCVENQCDRDIEIKILFAMPNMIGFGGSTLKIPYIQTEWDEFDANTQSGCEFDKYTGVLYSHSRQYNDRRMNSVGEYFIGSEKLVGLISVEKIIDFGSETSLLSFWDDFKNWRSLKSKYTYEFGQRPSAAIALSVKISAKKKVNIPFYLAWRFPTLRTIYEWPNMDTPLTLTKIPTPIIYLADNNENTIWKSKEPLQKGDRINFFFKEDRLQKIKKIILKKSGKKENCPSALILHASGVNDSDIEIKYSRKKLEKQISGDDIIFDFDKPLTAKKFQIIFDEKKDNGIFAACEVVFINSGGSRAEIDFARSDAEFMVMQRDIQSVYDMQNFYTSEDTEKRFKDIKSTLKYAAMNKDMLFEKSFVINGEIMKSNLPYSLKLMMINDAFPIFTNTIFGTKNEFAFLESPVDMWGSLGTMDQRLASHAYIFGMFPKLNEIELMAFAKCQQDDGRIPHFCGNIYQGINTAKITYGIADWPDLSASFVLQVLKHYQWSDDKTFYAAISKNVLDAIDWFAKADTNGDRIAEGGSSFDYESLSHGAFSYSAILQASAYLAGKEWALYAKNTKLAAEYSRLFQETRNSLVKQLWNGEYLNKWISNDGAQKRETIFIATLAGDWAARSLGLKSVISKEIIEKQIGAMIKYQFKPFYPVPPMETTKDMKPVITKDCYILQHLPYFGCESIYRDFLSEGMEMFFRMFEITYLINKDPWHKYLNVKLDGKNYWGRSYMTAPSSWHLFYALSGASLDLPNERLFISPKLPSDMKSELHLPLYFGYIHLWLDYIPKKEFRLKVLRNYFDTKNIKTIKIIARDGDDNDPILLDKPFVLKNGATLDLLKFEKILAK